MNNENTSLTSAPEGESKPAGSFESNCQVCGYYVGASSVCHRCGARTRTRTSIRNVRMVALVGSLIGVVLLWVAAYMKQPDFIHIGDITPTMNNALVVVEGNVVEARQDEDGNTFRMTVSDNTGNIRINAFNQLNRFRDHFDNNLPSMGDTVRVTGALNISQAWGAAMFLNIPDRVRIVEEFQMRQKPIGDITVAHSGELFVIEASVSEYQLGQTRSGDPMHRITFSDGTGSISTVMWQNQFEALPEDARQAISRPGSRLRLAVRGDSFREEPQVELVDPGDPSNVEVLGIGEERAPVEPVSPLEELREMKIGDITTAHAGQTFKIRATIEEYSLGQTQAGDPMHRITLGDETDIIQMVLWSNQFQALTARAREAFSTQGSNIKMAVEGDEFRGTPQVDLMDAEDHRTVEVIRIGRER